MTETKKATLYIDVEDDITSIISKVKAASGSNVALVPPKRIGVLQSAVNLRLLQRAAKQSNKSLSVVTNNPALIALAATASIPVAKNLNTEPALVAAQPAGDDTEDVIDGAELPVGEHAGQVPTKSDRDEARGAAMAAALAGAGTATKPSLAQKIKDSAKKPSVPNFDTFRKKLLIGGILLFLLLVFILWSTLIAPHATIQITAKTEDESLNTSVRVVKDQATSVDKAVIAATEATASEDKSVDITPTGRKDVGEKATGTIDLQNSSLQDRTVQAGTVLTSSEGLKFKTDEGVTVPRGSVSCPDIFNCSGDPGEASVSVTAAENGSKYNAETGSVSGEPNGVSGKFAGPTSGGVSKFVTVVTDSDVQKAKQSIVKESSDDQAKALSAKLGSEVIAITKSLTTSYENVSVTPKVGEEVKGDAQLSVDVTYTMYGANKDEIEKYVEALMQKQFKDDKIDDQRIYDSGSDTASFQDVDKQNNGVKATLITTAKVGPKIDDETVKTASHGKRHGEVQQEIQTIQGVEQVEVKFFPFWLNTVPSDNKRISVEFSIDDK